MTPKDAGRTNTVVLGVLDPQALGLPLAEADTKELVLPLKLTDTELDDVAVDVTLTVEKLLPELVAVEEPLEDDAVALSVLVPQALALPLAVADRDAVGCAEGFPVALPVKMPLPLPAPEIEGTAVALPVELPVPVRVAVIVRVEVTGAVPDAVAVEAGVALMDCEAVEEPVPEALAVAVNDKKPENFI